ncbi:pyridoxal phosphate-dependent transferase [Zychaea mexicana]|uniref:pyridoxal phosphate-dependent transferase n=1 Tax=Zychaea mexicana TaxID=64656 RepID=UPI0022FEB86E|nr:pyridoxal phosphate-dependent transferase [Zychaea mexicana]KAI9499013.1 pyridoxal phosphate-dependent transferase [Zychaea mexicana]
MANELSKPMATVSQVYRAVEAALDGRRLTIVKNIVFILVLLNYWSFLYRKFLVGGPIRAIQDLQAYVKRAFFKQMRRLPAVQAKIDAELGKTLKDMEHSIMSREGDNVVQNVTLPKHGLSADKVLENLKSFQEMRALDWEGGKVSGTVYHGGEDLTNLLADAYRMYAVSNPLHPEVFPGVRRMEAESVAMVLSMYNAPAEGCGTMTSGGTESIIMACKAYRDMCKDLKGIHYPEMVVPETIHAAFMKASGYFNIKLILIPADPVTGQVNLKKMARAITSNTIMIAGSAINFPHGTADDIVSLGKLAKKHKIGLHVDCCLGSFIMPFLEKAGLPTVPFDFRVDGVTSISCDTHKYGFAPKGSSIVMYRSKKIRKYQYFLCSDWTGGIYASPSIAGSRPGALIAGCWAALINVGEDGYLESCRSIVGARQLIENTVRSISQLHVVGNPIASVIAFGAAEPINIYDVGDMLSERGWNLSPLQNPAALHISVTLPWVPSAEKFAQDLKEVVAELVADPSKSKGTTAGIYGTAASIPDRTIVEDVAAGFVDLLYKA